MTLLSGAAGKGLVVAHVWRSAALDRADLAVVNLVARLLLAARRGECELRIANPPVGLAELLALSGLDRLPHLHIQMVRQPEQGEEALRVQEDAVHVEDDVRTPSAHRATVPCVARRTMQT